jgi:hypothetical protein
MAEEKTVTLVGNKSSGYNYKYTSLGDLVMAGVKLPPMRVAVLVDGEQNPVLSNGQPIEYIEALRTYANKDGEIIKEEWIRGARIVIPSGNKMNEAQAYGSALTYARRYTALTVLGIACDDDNKIEVHSKEESEAQIMANGKKDLEKLYAKTDGKDFEAWFNTIAPNGLTMELLDKARITLMQQINKKADKEKK